MRTHIRRYPTPGHTYYFDATNGLDANTGQADQPRQTVTGVNAIAYKPATRVLLKKGETFSGVKLSLGPTAGKGANGRHFLLGAYGAGAAPIIDCAGLTYISFFNAAVTHFTIDGLDFQNSASGGGISLDSAEDVVIRNCNIQGAGGQGIQITTAASLHRKIHILNNTIHNNGTSGMEIGYAAAPGPREIIVRGNTCYSNGTTTGHHGIYVKTGNTAEVTDNTCYSNTGGGINCRLNQTNTVVGRNRCYSNAVNGVACETLPDGTVQFINNLCDLNTSNGIWLGANVVGLSVLHNTTVNNGNRGTNISQQSAQGNTFKNNLGYVDNAVVPGSKVPISCAHADNVTGNTFDKNDWYYEGAADVAYVAGTWYTLAEWQALAGSPDPNSQSADPVFVTEYTDLHLQVTSPCIGAGDATVGVLVDKDSVVRGVAVDQGCYEFIA